MTKEQKLKTAWEFYLVCRGTLFKYGGKKFSRIWVEKETVYWKVYSDTRSKIESGA